MIRGSIPIALACLAMLGCASRTDVARQVPPDAEPFERTGDDGTVIERGYEVVDDRGNRIVVGPYAAFHDDGTVRATGQYLDGLKHGWWSYWNEDGDLDRRVLYDEGHAIRTERPPLYRHYRIYRHHYYYHPWYWHHPYHRWHPHTRLHLHFGFGHGW